MSYYRCGFWYTIAGFLHEAKSFPLSSNGVFPPLFGHARAILLVVRVERGLTNAVVHAESYFTNAIFCADTTATVFTGCSRLSRGHGF